MKETLKKILPDFIIIILRKILKKISQNPNDPRRFWQYEDLNVDNKYFEKLLGKSIKCKKITFQNQTKTFFLSKKNLEIPLIDFNNNDDVRLTYYFENSNIIGNNLKIRNDKDIVLDVKNAKPKQFYNVNIIKESESLNVINESKSKLWISIESQGKKNINVSGLNNVFLIFLDSISLDYLEKHIDKMPFTQKFFKDKISYQNVYSNADWTASSLTSLINSELPSRHRFTDLKTSHKISPVKENNLFSFFKSHGYVTNFLHRAKAQNPAFGFDKDVDNYYFYPFSFGTEIDDQKILNKVLELFYTNINYKNFFLLHFNSTHYPFSNDNLFNQINNSKFYNDNPSIFLENIIEQKGKTKTDNVFTKEGVEIMNKKLVTSLKFLDLQLNSLYSFIMEKGLFETTNVIITSDNGSSYADNDENFLLNERRSKVPFIMSNKNFKITNLAQSDVFSNLVDFKSIAKNMISGENIKFEEYVISEAIFNEKYEVCFFYHNKRINFSCQVDQTKNKIYLKKKLIFYDGESNSLYLDNIDLIPKDYLKLIKQHLKKTNFEIVE